MLLVRLLVLYIIFLGVLGRWRWPSVERWASPPATDTKQTEYGPLRTRREPATAPAWALSWGIEMAKTETENRQR